MTDAVTLAAAMVQWRIGGASVGAPVQSKSGFSGPAERNYSLFNTKRGLLAHHEDQACGINLGYTDDASPNTELKSRRWFFASEAGENVRYGDVIALGNGGQPSFVFNTHRNCGVNLDYSESPHREWQLVGGVIGQPVRVGDTVALLNNKCGLPLIYFDRTAGGSFGWPDSQTWGEQIAAVVSDIAIRAAIELLKSRASAA